MKFNFFENLTSEEAQIFSQQYLEIEAEKADLFLQQCLLDGVNADYSLESLAHVLRWVIPKMQVLSKSPDLDLPEWIRNSETYAKNLFEFDEPSKILTLRSSYYLGETFVRNFSVLHWSIGKSDTALGNMPVVTGFQFSLEMPPILVCENLFRRAIVDSKRLVDVDRAVKSWSQKV